MMHTLPDLLRPHLNVVFVGINPSTYSVERGHYFSRKTNRFWPAFSRSRLSQPVRQALGLDVLLPEHDVILPDHGIGFTDVVKVPSSNATAMTAAHFQEWTPRLRDRLQQYAPRVACFHGLMGFRPFVRWGLQEAKAVQTLELGPQPFGLGATRLFVIPNPSPANAHFTLDDQVEWYNRLADYLQSS